MGDEKLETFVSDLSGQTFPIAEKVSGQVLRESILAIIHKDHPTFLPDQHLSMPELNQYRLKYIESYLTEEAGNLTEIEKGVLENIREGTTLTDKMEEDPGPTRSFGQQLADKVASFGGSWTFIIIFFVILNFWMMLNIVYLHDKGFDPYPFILLNLVLSCIAAIQAPIIMMSQNRQEEKDRERAKKDYMVNLKSELEIRMLHEKMDHLIIHQQQELMAIQQIQVDMLCDILKRIESPKVS